ncbi:GNAT family N-acetyltransferase [Pseudarthrobacter sp. J75]|uniref:GNAT family N-acetyltransferase n=1 Tax=unclassified Pseudarthrobacter TaxID=2647000 RepID=UPI002E80D2ED|nr:MULTISPECIES: GNAT family N-acetyltransferase [unclassified Pseudarthrobacter]MEE2521137.1 GNAT family N-acetyltransferase [Pseudarthrobacter sp. J47]MEE2528367.1 GNAT family N-acetyltransferase [Pseudarthrobacter sp. J75]
MSTLKGRLDIAAVAIPSAAGRPPQDFEAYQALREAVELERWGDLDRCPTRQESLVHWQGTPYEERRLFLARLDGEPVGACWVELPLRENTATAGIQVLVAKPFRRRGIGTALLEFAEQAATAKGRTSLDGYVEIPAGMLDGATDLLPAKSGAGALPLSVPAIAFAAASGYQLEQVERSSRLDLAGIEPRLAELETALVPAASNYGLAWWQGQCPEELVEDFAALKRRMSTSVPIAGMDWEEEDWDAERVRREEARLAASGYESILTAARAPETGQLVAYTELNWRPGTRTAFQQDTLVVSEHRGRNLGMRLKIANLRRATHEWPAAWHVLTWNAAENRHMLAINVALGFRAAGYQGEWQKRLK